MAAKRFKRKPQKSIRVILIIWFLLFSVLPLGFVTFYSVIKYEKAINNELNQRLQGNAREINTILNDFRSGLVYQRNKYIKDTEFVYSISTNDLSVLKSIGTSWLRADLASSMTFFGRNGRLLVSVEKDAEDEVRGSRETYSANLYLSDENLEKIKQASDYTFVEYPEDGGISLILLSKVRGNGNRLVGYLEQLIRLNDSFVNRLKERMKLEILIARPSGQVVASTNSDFKLYKRDFFQSFIQPGENVFFELTVRSDPFGFLLYPIRWGQNEIYLGLGASKKEALDVLENVNYAFLTVVGGVILLLVISILVASNTLIKPVIDLVEAIDQVESSEKIVEIPVRSDTEIGLLTESFNDMSKSVIRARSDLKRKVQELETANQELKDTQARLVHSSKMISLGQLVAGVAHELNNPIGFIYSNMSHLRDYAEKLIRFAEAAEKDPTSVEKLRKDLEVEYIKQDLPKLIFSCEDGARRTRDIVVGLRNFSRLEEAKLKEIDIHQAIDDTLNLLTGEIKNRIQIIKKYNQLPRVTCYASHINQVFMNLLSNAAQAIEGHGNIWIATSQTNRSGEPFVEISFQDSGKGMSEEVIEKIFDPFFSTKGVGQGTGLGLSISYGIVQKHGGEIRVKSQPGIGTEFTVLLPVTAKPSTQGSEVA